MSGRLYRGTWLLVGLPLLVAALSVSRPSPLPGPVLPPAFDKTSAVGLAKELAKLYPDRSPGSAGALGAASWFSDKLALYGLRTQAEPFFATIPGRGRVRLVNLVAEVPGASPQGIVVMAHRDDAGTGSGADDNASGTAALIELARSYASASASPSAPPKRVSPAHTIVFLSTDGGAFGALGAEHFAADAAGRSRVVAVVNLDSLAGRAAPRIELAGDDPRSPAASLVETAAVRILEQTGDRPRRRGALAQLIDLGFPFSLYEQAPFVGRGIPAVTLTTADDRPPSSFGDTLDRLNGNRLAALGRAAQDLLGSLDQGPELAQGTSSYVYLGGRLVRGWAIELVLVAALLPFLLASVDLFARCRRRRIRLAPAVRSYRSRLGFWLFAGALFELFAVVGVWPGGAARPLSPESPAAGDWPFLGLAALALLSALGWLVARERLLPRRTVSAEDELAGHAAALLALGVVGLLAVATNPFALIFLLPSLHAWLWLPQVQRRPAWARAAVFVSGLVGPLLLVGSFAIRFDLGLDAPWYLAELVAVGYVPLTVPVIFLAWLAAAGQLSALAAGRYAPYPSAAERPPRGPIRETVRRVVLVVRDRRRVTEERRRALGG